MAAEGIGFSMAASVIGSVTNILFGPIQDSIANQFKDSDVAKESVHEVIVRDLKDIKSKLEYLSLKDLDTSYSFMKEGVQLLNLAIDSPSRDENENPPGEANRVLKDSASDILKEASSLCKAIPGLNISSKDRFLTAKDRFRASRERATDAFNNRSLNTKNRIMACKLRVAATILESGLEDPQVAVAACLVSIKELHGLPQIQDMLSVFLKGGLFRSRYKAAERFENIMSILFISHALFDFASKYSNEYPNVFTWPGIQLKDRNVNPILDAREILEKTVGCEEFSRQLSRIVVRNIKPFYDFAMYSRSEVIVPDIGVIRFIESTGECKLVRYPKLADTALTVIGRAIAGDSNDDVYVVGSVARFRGSDLDESLVLYVFDENYNLKHETTLGFFSVTSWLGTTRVKIAVDKNEYIIMIKKGDSQVYVCDSRGELKFQFERDSSEAYSLSITNNNDIMIPSDDQRSVHVYTTKGTLKSPIETPEGHEIKKVAFHHAICKMIVLTHVSKLRSFCLLCYSETGEVENSQVLNAEDRSFDAMDIASHPSGLFVVQSSRKVPRMTVYEFHSFFTLNRNDKRITLRL